MNRKCLICGKDLPNQKTKYCSIECRREANLSKWKKPTKCEGCGFEMTYSWMFNLDGEILCEKCLRERIASC